MISPSTVLRRTAIIAIAAGAVIAAAASAEAAVPASADAHAPSIARADTSRAGGWPLLVVGSRGVDVESVQYLLGCARTSWAVTADGIFGAKTESGVKAFQGTVGLKTDGKVGTKTWTKLTDGKAFGSTVRRGDTGRCVKAAQRQLEALGKPTEMTLADGIFGPVTERSVKAFQQKHDLTANGVVGPKTWKALIIASD